MAGSARLKTTVLRVVALGIALAAAHGARGAGPDLSGFLGVWTFRGGSSVKGTCGPVPYTEQLANTRVSLHAGTTTDLIFDIGCRCAIGLTVDPSGKRATIAGPRSCTMIAMGEQITGDIDTLTVERQDDGSLGVTLVSEQAHLTLPGNVCPLSALGGAGTLVRSGDGAIDCGAPETAVGVISVAPSGTGDCPIGAGMEGLRIQMSDEITGPCSGGTGSAGEGRWLLPDDDHPRTLSCPGLGNKTVLHFCRVDGARFHPLTTEADPSSYYAVLKLGTVCPNGSVEVAKRIDNEDDSGAEPGTVTGDPGPNEVATDPQIGTSTRLVFCFFRAGAGATMTAFPDLGFPYAVYHRPDRVQPPWVLLKRWQQSNDEDTRSSTITPYDAPDPAIAQEFTALVENEGTTTTFNFARVR